MGWWNASMLLLCWILVTVAIADAQPVPATSEPRSLASTTRLFLDAGEIYPASEQVPTRNILPSETVVQVATAGGQQAPALKVVTINQALLATNPKRLLLNLPNGATVTAVRRGDMDRLASTAMAAPVSTLAQQSAVDLSSTSNQAYSGPAVVWVGEVLGARGPLSSVVLILSENGGLYGNIRYLDRRSKHIRTFRVSPMLLDGADPVTAAALPNIAPASADVTLADLFPATHPSMHVIVEYVEYEPPPPAEGSHDALVYNGPPEAANAQPAIVDTTPAGLDATTVAALPLPTDVTALAASIAASAGPDAAAQMGPDGSMAAATDWLQRVQGAASTAPPATDPSTAEAASSSTSSTQPSLGRKLQQTSDFNSRQDVLVLYSSGAAGQAGGTTQIENTIRSQVVATNKAYADSGVAIDLILVGIRQTSYTGTNLDTALDAMGNGNVRELATARDELGADFVQMWIASNGGSYCGLAWITASRVAPLNSVLNSLCFTGWGFAHELGHNQGCTHSSGTSSGVPSYGAGWKRCNLGSSRNFNTIMEYSCGGDTSIGLVSNPSLRYSNVAAGDATRGHCARRISETAPAISSVRAEKFNTATSSTIKSQVLSSKCVDAVKFVQGTQMAINDCSTTRSQQRWERVPDGSLRSPSTTRCMQAANTTTGGVSNAEIWECNGALNQQWFIDIQGRLHPYSTPNRCLTLPGAVTTNGQRLTVSNCTSTNEQRWSNTTAIFPRAFNPQNSSLQSALSTTNPTCIEALAYNTTNGARVGMMPCNTNRTTNSNQQWVLGTTGLLQLRFNRAKCMEAAGTGNNGDGIRIWDCLSIRDNQRWFQDALGRLRAYHAPSRCLDVRNGSLAVGATLQLFNCLDANQQKWLVVN